MFRIKLIYLGGFVGLLSSYFLSKSVFFQSANVPVILWWTPFISTEDRFINCNKRKCLVTNNRSYIGKSNLNTIVFYGSLIESHDLPLPRSKLVLWSLFHGESPKNLPILLYKEAQNLFNITSTFSQYSSYPLTLQYLPDIKLLKDKEHYLDVKEKNRLLNNLAPIVYIQSNCDTVNDRDDLVKTLMNYINIDSYGHCLNNRQLPNSLKDEDPLDLYSKNLMRFISKYKFIIGIENAICHDYISEKLWRPLIVGSIPIYLGSPTVENWLPNNNSAILMKNFKTVQALAKFIDEVNRNDDLYESYMKHKRFGEITNTILINSFKIDKFSEYEPLNFECYLCDKAYEAKTESGNILECEQPGLNSSWHYHWIMAKYQAKALFEKIKQNRPFGKEEFNDYLLTLWSNKTFS